MDIDTAAATHVGLVRDTNEDAVHIGTAVFAVADGMGGHVAGEVASGLAVQAVASADEASLPADPQEAGPALAELVRRANRAVHDDARRDPDHRGMGTTLTTAAVTGEALVVAHVGDSRAYLVRDGRAEQLTRDHATGPYTLTRVVGLEPEVEVDVVGPVPLRAGDAVLLCSDGLPAVVGDDDLPALVAAPDAESAAQALVQATLDRGAPDNVAVVVLAVR